MQGGNEELSASYFLARDVYACASSGCVVFLDMNSGRYLTLRQDAARALSGCIAGWPVRQQAAEQESSLFAHPRRLLDQLARKGLLTTQAPCDGDHHLRPAVAAPAGTLLDLIYMHAPAIRAHHVASFLLCCYRARALLRWGGLQRVVERVRRRKAALAAHAECSDPERTLALTAIFHRLQPLALDGLDGCLLQSFAHLEFLLHHGLTAQWVFAVRGLPFSAHCWLQQGSVLLNDFPQRAGYLSPILAV